MHLTFVKIVTRHVGSIGNRSIYRFDLSDSDLETPLDDRFFYSVPTSFFVLDNRIPAVLRELLTEAEGSLKSNFLTGASACARKLVYELAVHERAEGNNYEDRIKSLKRVHPDLDPAFFDTLLTVQQVTSSKVHENAYDGWEAQHVRLILATLREILHELYVIPAQRKRRRQAVLELKGELLDNDNGLIGDTKGPSNQTPPP